MDSAPVFSEVFKKFTAWMDERELGSKFKFAVLTDWYAHTLHTHSMCTHTLPPTPIHTYTHTHTYPHPHTHTHTHTPIHTHTHTHTHIHIPPTPIHTYTHTHTHTYTYPPPPYTHTHTHITPPYTHTHTAHGTLGTVSSLSVSLLVFHSQSMPLNGSMLENCLLVSTK